MMPSPSPQKNISTSSHNVAPLVHSFRKTHSFRSNSFNSLANARSFSLIFHSTHSFAPFDSQVVAPLFEEVEIFF